MGGMSSSREPLRLVRGAGAATVATAVAAGGHVLGGGIMPSWLGMALPWWLSVTVCTVLAGSRFSLPRMMTAILASQTLFHTVFVVGTRSASPVVMVDPPGSHLGHGLHPAGAADMTSSLSIHSAHGTGAVVEQALHGSHGGGQMALAHVLAAVVTALLLHRGETFLFRCFSVARQLVGALCPRLRAEPALIDPPLLRLRPAPAVLCLLHAQRALLSLQRRRGPPLLLAA